MIYFGLKATHEMHKNVDGYNALPHTPVPE
jgi:hypothetical protein